MARVGSVFGMDTMQREPCGRPTRRGTQCPRSRNAMTVRAGSAVFVSPACASHLTDAERAERQTVMDLQEASRRAAEPACWSWPVPDAANYGGPEDDFRRFYDFHDGRCAVCGRIDPALVEDHDHYTGFTRGELCRGCNTIEGMSSPPIIVKYRQRNPAAILGLELVYVGPFWEYERDAGKFQSTPKRTMDLSVMLGLKPKSSPATDETI